MSLPKIDEKLISRWQLLFKDELDDFLKAIEKPLTPSIRINTLRGSKDHILNELQKRGIKLSRIPWCDTGFWVHGSEDLGNSWEHFAGLIYIQEASSMIPAEIVDLDETKVVLDMAAAPGSKTTQIAQKMNNKGLIVANDIDYKRIKALTSNIERLGVLNVHITIMDGRRFGKLLPNTFDVVFVDAPCSAEGTIRKSYKALYNWKEWIHKKLSETQKMLLVSAYKTCKVNGTIIYSTCTFAPEENESVVSYLLEKYPCHLEDISINGLVLTDGLTEWMGERYKDELKKAKRIYPHKNEVGGFFIAKIIKDG